MSEPNGKPTPGEPGDCEREDRYRLLVENTLDYAIFLLGTSGIIVSWNAGAERLEGYSAEEIIGRHVSLFYPQETRLLERVDRQLEIAQSEGRYAEQGWRVRKDGTQFWASVVITALYDGEGRLIGYGDVTRDLTERREAEETLRRSEAVHRLLVDRVKDYAIFMLDTSGRIQTWNFGAERIKGYRSGEIIGRYFSVFYSEADRAAGKPERELEIAAAVGQCEDEGWRYRRDGTRFWASVLITAPRDETGELRGFGKVTRDLSERRRLEQDLMRQNATLEDALLSKDRFLASMSHELRTPLNAILGYTGTLLMKLPGPLNPDQEKQLRTVQAGGRHLLSLINDLLDLARLDAGKVEIRREPVRARQILEDVVTTLRPIASAKGLDLSVRCAGADFTIATDRRALSQILINLVNNACKFTDRGAVRLEAEAGGPGGPAAVFRVADDGIGIRDEDLARLFQPFVRLGRDEGVDRDGTGLGLHLSQRLAETLGGRIAVESEFGRGSRFTLYLGEG